MEEYWGRETHSMTYISHGAVMTEKHCPLDSWMTSGHDIIKITELETDHLANIVALLLRDKEQRNPQRSKIVSLKKELVKRLTA